VGPSVSASSADGLANAADVLVAAVKEFVRFIVSSALIVGIPVKMGPFVATSVSEALPNSSRPAINARLVTLASPIDG